MTSKKLLRISDCHATRLEHAFAMPGFRPGVHLQLDIELADGRGFAKFASTLGGSSAGGSIRLRPSRQCVAPVLERSGADGRAARMVARRSGKYDDADPTL